MKYPVEEVARLCHEANRGYCHAIGDTAQVPWNEAEDWQKQSAIAGVEAIRDNPAMTPEQSHWGWMLLKESEGWVYGEVKDSVAKTHPCITDYANLPESQRAKDYIFGAIIRACL